MLACAVLAVLLVVDMDWLGIHWVGINAETGHKLVVTMRGLTTGPQRLQ
jgi:hypothetical protein